MHVPSHIPGIPAQTIHALAALCAKHRIRAVRVFGSCVRNQLTPESDLDLLIEFQPGVDPDLFELG